MEKVGNEAILTPKLPDLKEHNDKKLKALYSIGAYASANMFLRKLEKDGDEDGKIHRYFHELTEAEKSPKTVITTHERMLFIDSPNKENLIIDEDPINSLLKQDKVYLSDLIIFRSIWNLYYCDTSLLDRIISRIENMAINDVAIMEAN
ncbi:MAG: hypothetical protein GX640_11465, partial [Fibrobacter sp.]|nr:hypothetical protein [Fibrobacter sp.]